MTRTSFVLGIGLFLFLIMLGVLMISDQPHPPQQQHGLAWVSTERSRSA